ncbi:hypothetical protein [Roseomonas elaeocarpi]|uniref:Uncharacterized protein n=1 Tax=Roseomonas elaeocarpi TaxID=907779 RepID=A0ABV6JWL7_9PROT
MSKARLEFRTTRDLLKDGVTLILFSEGGQVLAEIIGPEGYDDAVMVMPKAILTALNRTLSPAALAVLDDEDLWQEEWGTLRGSSMRPNLRDLGAPEPK